MWAMSLPVQIQQLLPPDKTSPAKYKVQDTFIYRRKFINRHAQASVSFICLRARVDSSALVMCVYISCCVSVHLYEFFNMCHMYSELIVSNQDWHQSMFKLFFFSCFISFGHWRIKLRTNDVYFFPFLLVWSAQQASHTL